MRNPTNRGRKEAEKKSYTILGDDQNSEAQQPVGKKRAGKKSSFVNVDVIESYGGSEGKVPTTQSEKSRERKGKRSWDVIIIL